MTRLLRTHPWEVLVKLFQGTENIRTSFWEESGRHAADHVFSFDLADAMLFGVVQGTLCSLTRSRRSGYPGAYDSERRATR